MKILLFGKRGQLGWELQRSLEPLGEVVALDRNSAPLCGDLADLDGLARTIRAVSPQLIVNAAAYTAVDRAEGEPDLAQRVNAEAPAVMARQAQALGAWLVHYSTDYVFDGSGDRPWLETDAPAPLNTYGRTKLEGERLAAHCCDRHLIFRTSWVYGVRGGNFAKTMLRLAQEREQISVVDDQFGAPTSAELLADVTVHAVRQAMAQDRHAGLYHLAASGETTWHGYAKHVIEHARRAQPAIKVVAKEVLPVDSAAFKTVARRPHNSRLDTRKLRTAFGLSLPPWQSGVHRLLVELGLPAA